MKRIKSVSLRVAVCVVLSLFARLCFGDTFYELAGGIGQYNLSITQKRGEDRFDESETLNLSVGAYRHVSDKSAWGAVVEVNHARSRDEALPSDGRLVSFRPINYLRYIGNNTSIELYAGAAQYSWRKTANGYYFGSSIRWEILDNRLGFGLDAKYYQDLAFDSAEGDDIVDGWHPGLKLFYRFK